MTTKKIPLQKALKKGDNEITSIDLRKPNSGELRGLQIATLQVGDVNALIKLIPRIATPVLTEQDVNEMDPSDLAECGEVVAGFLMTSATRAYQQTSTN